MKKLHYWLFAMAFTLTLFVACTNDSGDLDGVASKGKKQLNTQEMVVVANRGDGSVSFINARTNELDVTVALPDGAEPMYVVYVEKYDKLYVGDRANSQVHVMDPESKSVVNSINVGHGVFHMWADGKGKRLWVNNDIDNTISVINLASGKVMDTIYLDGKPHDVFLTDDGSMAYVSILVPAGPDKVYAFNANNRKQVASTEVGEDPHLFHIPSLNKLFVPCQNTDQVITFNGSSLEPIEDAPVAGAHGIFADLGNDLVYVTEINVSKIHTLGTVSGLLERESVDTQFPVPHNVVVNATGNKLFVTHSGATAQEVSIYETNNGNISQETVVTTATNPFGLAYVLRKTNK